ncbi:MAG: TolC family protein [Bacteroidales bacterium]
MIYRFSFFSGVVTKRIINDCTGAGMNLHISIFSKMSGIYGVQNAKIELNRQTLQVEEVKFQLNQEVRKAMLNVLTAKKRRESASKWVSANKEPITIRKNGILPKSHGF